ncbi:MAG: 4-hydroxy-tetrahydrodipicolinate synthase [Pseudomonadota bacterium]
MAPDWLRGSMTAIVTPFKEGLVDEKAFAALIERQIAGRSKAIVAAGTTGEAATLTADEHIGVIAKAVEISGGRIPVIGGCGANVTADAVDLAKACDDVGAQGIMATTGYYNKPSRDGLLAHYRALAEATSLPMVLYNVPSRTASDLTPDLIGELSQLPTAAALKDASGDLARQARHRLLCPSDFVFVSGEDITAVGFNAMGGMGCISVTANVAPALCAEMQEACLAGDYAQAQVLQDRLTPLHDALFSDASPAPAKYALAQLGLIEEELRLPLVSASENARKAVDAALQDLDL